MHKFGILLSLITLLFLAACSGSGVTSCTNLTGIVGSYADCNVTYDQVGGSQTVSFDLGDVAVVMSIHAKMTVSVKSGAVRFSYTDDEGKLISHDVTPDQPLQVDDWVAIVMVDEVEFRFDANGGIANGISLSAHFE
ncbi:MAG: hypothetical protein GC204_07040 [Chloroflexi bacterium]|nr:hypothetical protein [Chloroflexota bacterium]